MKLLILRFSSFGDIVQNMGVLPGLKENHSDIHIGWAMKEEFRSIVALAPQVERFFVLPKKSGLKEIWRLAKDIKAWGPDVIYDAHQTPRTFVLLCMLFLIGVHARVIKRSKNRWRRFLLFYLRINTFPKPFRGMQSYAAPLIKANLCSLGWQQSLFGAAWIRSDQELSAINSLVPDLAERIALVPSAAWQMKRWPLSHWKELIALMPSQKFVVLGGHQDDFCAELLLPQTPNRVINLAGKLNLLQSSLVVSQAKNTLSADTGLIHIADLMQRPGVLLMGPTAFGFTTSDKIRILETNLACRPCTKDGRGRCSQKIYQQCMVDIVPSQVALALK